MTILYYLFMIAFGLFAGFVVGSSGPVGIVQGLICGAIAGALLCIPVRSMGNYFVLALIVSTIAGSLISVNLSDQNVLKQTCSKFGLSIKIGNGKK